MLLNIKVHIRTYTQYVKSGVGVCYVSVHYTLPYIATLLHSGSGIQYLYAQRCVVRISIHSNCMYNNPLELKKWDEMIWLFDFRVCSTKLIEFSHPCYIRTYQYVCTVHTGMYILYVHTHLLPTAHTHKARRGRVGVTDRMHSFWSHRIIPQGLISGIISKIWSVPHASIVFRP